jgi:hypothetical protein
MSTQKSRFEGLFEQQVSQPEQPERKPIAQKVTGEETMKVRNQEIKKRRRFCPPC